MSPKIPGLMRFVSLAAWKTSTEPSASSWRVRDVRAQNVPAVTPPTLKKTPQIIKAVLILRGLLKCWPDCEGLTHRGPQWGRPLWRSPPSPGWGAQRCCWWDCLGSASGGRGSVSPPEQSRPVKMKKKDVCHEKSQTVSGPQISGLPLLPQFLPLAEIWHRWGKKVHNF